MGRPVVERARALGRRARAVQLRAVAAIASARAPRRWSTSAALRLLTIALLATGAAAFGVRFAGRPPAVSPPSTLVEPRPAADFLAAYARGDVSRASQLASPLYRAEWARRGFTIQDQEALLPASLQAGNNSAEWLRFSYVGGAIDAGGFGHLLYLSRSTGDAADASPAAWRVDVDPSGKVIWDEMVYLFSPDARAVAPVDPAPGGPAIALPAGAPAGSGRVLAGARAGSGPEAYYLVAIDSGPPVGNDNRPRKIAFLAVDETGQIRRAIWSFGRMQTGFDAQGHLVVSGTVALPDDQERLWKAYIAALAG